MKQTRAEIIREYGPFPGVERVDGVTYDGRQVWFASAGRLNVLNPDSGELVRTLDIPGDAGTAFDGKHIYQICDDRIEKIDPASGDILSTIPCPGGKECSGMAWAEGALWVGQYQARKIHEIDPATGKLLRTLETNRFVTGVTWIDGELWHGAWDDDGSAIRRIDPETGEVRESCAMPDGVGVSGLEYDGVDRFYCGCGGSGKVRAVRRPSG